MNQPIFSSCLQGGRTRVSPSDLNSHVMKCKFFIGVVPGEDTMYYIEHIPEFFSW